MSHKERPSTQRPSTQHPGTQPPALPCTGVESHAHLDSRRFAGDLHQVLSRAKSAGVAQIGQVFLSPNSWRMGKDAYPSHPNHPEVFFLLGIHPSEAHEFSPEIPDEIQTIAAKEKRIKAIGEIGLDYHWKECPPNVQKAMFIRQLHVAKELDLPVVIHCREAEKDTFAILKDEGMHGHPLLWHCFGGNTAMADRIVDAGWHLSIPGPVTYPANAALREAVAAAPLDRLMVETDCPYLTPVPLRGKRNEPAYLAYTIAAMAEARRTTPAELWTACGDNARKFFRLV